RVDYRSGYYQRFIGTTHGKVEISMPKARRTPVKYGLFKKYQRRQEQFDDNIVKAMILGLTGRKQKKIFKSFIGDSVSHTTASRIIDKIGCLVNHYRNIPLFDEY
ncbi:MAG: transposase, partial [Candidatus Omnitrophica bacterium]|nr:transposase [Candidatus Omnitrophota bacterium]